MKRGVVILMSLCLTLAFIPVMSFAADNVQALTSGQISGATELTVNQNITPVPSPTNNSIYKFTPSEDGYYGFTLTSKEASAWDRNEGGGLDMDLALYKGEESTARLTGSGGIQSGDGNKDMNLLVGSEQLKSGETYYVQFNFHTDYEIDTAKFVKFNSCNANIAASTGGQIVGEDGNEISKMTIIDKISSSYAKAVPFVGYAYYGLFLNGNAIGDPYEFNYDIEYNSSLNGATLTPKFIATNDAQMRFAEDTVVDGLMAESINSDENRISWNAIGEGIIFEVVGINSDNEFEDYGYTDGTALRVGKSSKYQVRAVKQIDGGVVASRWFTVK